MIGLDGPIAPRPAIAPPASPSRADDEQAWLRGAGAWWQAERAAAVLRARLGAEVDVVFDGIYGDRAT